MENQLWGSAMVQPYQPTESATLVISEVIAPYKLEAYKAWTQNINQATQKAPGFLGVELLQPRDEAIDEYIAIIRFDSYSHLRQWVTSPTYRYWIEQSKELIEVRSQRRMTSGMEFWLSPPPYAQERKLPQPPYYKQVILGVLAVYPLIVLVDWIIGDRLQSLPPLLALLISVMCVSALLNYPVMPLLTKLLEPWLYPKR